MRPYRVTRWDERRSDDEMVQGLAVPCNLNEGFD